VNVDPSGSGSPATQVASIWESRSRWLIGTSTRNQSRQLFCGGPGPSGLLWLSPRDIWDTLVDHCLETNVGKAAPRRKNWREWTTQQTQITQNRTPNKQSAMQQQTMIHRKNLIKTTEYNSRWKIDVNFEANLLGSAIYRNVVDLYIYLMILKMGVLRIIMSNNVLSFALYNFFSQIFQYIIWIPPLLSIKIQFIFYHALWYRRNIIPNHRNKLFYNMFIMETIQRYNRTLGIHLLPMNDYFIKYFFKINIKKIYFYKPVWKSIAVFLSTFLLLFFPVHPTILLVH